MYSVIKKEIKCAVTALNKLYVTATSFQSGFGSGASAGIFSLTYDTWFCMVPAFSVILSCLAQLSEYVWLPC